MKINNLVQPEKYSCDWIKDFYDQAAIWWGPGSEIPEEDQKRARSVNRLCGPGSRRVLELGCGAGHTAAATAAIGHEVIAIDISSSRIQQAKENFPGPLKGSLTFIEGDFFTIQLPGKFDVITYWDGFGVQNDSDHRSLFHRIAREWLAPDGSFLVDVVSTAWVVHNAGKEFRLDPLPEVPGSVEMLRRWHFDAFYCRWIDEWIPIQQPQNALSQTIRCYTPADFNLLVESTGLTIKYIEVNDQPLNLDPDKINLDDTLVNEYSFLTQLTAV